MESFWRKIRVGWLSVRVRVAIYSEIIRHDPGFYGVEFVSFVPPHLVFDKQVS